MAPKSYWSYGKINHKDGAMIPEGRAEGCTHGLKAVWALTKPYLSITPGTLIPSHEVYEVLRRG